MLQVIKIVTELSPRFKNVGPVLKDLNRFSILCELALVFLPCKWETLFKLTLKGFLLFESRVIYLPPAL